MPEPTETRSTVAALLAAAGLRLPDAEVDALVEMYGQLRAAADSLDIREVREEEPALLPSVLWLLPDWQSYPKYPRPIGCVPVWIGEEHRLLSFCSWPFPVVSGYFPDSKK